MENTISIDNKTEEEESAAAATDKLKNLLRLLEMPGVKSLDELQSNLEHPAERELLKCASVVQNFDETLYT